MSQKKQSALSTARKALAVANRLNGSREVKYALTSFSLQTNRDGTISTLNDVPQGLGDSARVGDRVQCKSLEFSLWRVIPGSASGRFSARFIIFEDLSNSITSPSQVLLSTGSAYAPFLSYVKDYRLRFRVLYDSKSNHMDQYNKGTVTQRKQPIHVQTRYSAATDEITSGAIKLLVISNMAETTTSKPLVLGHVRVNYTDS
jgi:hypothetical protein